MGIDVEAELRGDHLHIRCRGVYSLAAALAAYRRVFEIAAGEGMTAILIDAREIEGDTPTTTDRYDIGEYIAKHGRGCRLALVGSEPVIDPNRFGQLVANNRGAIAGVFTDKDEALGLAQG